KKRLFGSGNKGSPPWMIGSRTTRTWSDFGRSRSRLLHATRNRFKRRTGSRRPVPQQQFQEASQGLFTACVGTLVSPLLTAVLPLLRRGLPGLLPAIIADSIAQHQHGIDIVTFPMHAC